MFGLYLHIPFCRRKCGYCDFTSTGFGEPLAADYLRALEKELEGYAGGQVSTVYIGGGTPTVLSAAQLSRLCSFVKKNFDLSSCGEFTVEANPESLTPARADALRAAGADRLSIGVQSLDDGELGFLGRVHSAAEARQAFETARKAGFDNLNLDFIYGIPGQSPDGWRSTLKTAAALGPEHLSLYPLTIEEGTPLHHDGTVTDDDLQAGMFALADELLAGEGYEHYEISNWARPGFHSRHNLSYWENKNYIGAGAAAASYMNGVRRTNCDSIDRYVRLVSRGESPAAESEEITPDRREAERIILGLRCRDGVAIPAETAAKHAEALGRLAGDGLIEREGGRIRLTRRGMFLANRVMSEFV